MKTIIAALALLVSTSAGASWVYNWEGQCGGNYAFGCSTAEASFTVPDAYHPGTSFACYGFEKCIDFITARWTINYPDKPSVTTIMAPQTWFFWNLTMVLPTGPHDGTAAVCWNSCGDAGIIIRDASWSLMDGYRYVSGTDYRWAPPEHVDEPNVLALLLLGFAALLWRGACSPLRH